MLLCYNHYIIFWYIIFYDMNPILIMKILCSSMRKYKCMGKLQEAHLMLRSNGNMGTSRVWYSTFFFIGRFMEREGGGIVVKITIALFNTFHCSQSLKRKRLVLLTPFYWTSTETSSQIYYCMKIINCEAEAYLTWLW